MPDLTDDDLPVGVDTTFAIIPTWVLESSVSDRAVRLYGVLRRVADARGYGWAKRRTLAEKLHVSDEKTVDRALRELVDLGAVRVVERWSEPRDGTQPHRLANGYLVLSTQPVTAQGGGGTSAPTPTSAPRGGGGTSAPRVGAENGEQEREPLNESPSLSGAHSANAGPSAPTPAAAKATTGKRATRLAPDWRPTTEHVAYAAGLGFTAQQTTRMGEDFRDYWVAQPGARGTKLDWEATWRRWCRTEADRQGIRPASERPAARPTTPQHMTQDQIKAARQKDIEEQMARLDRLDRARA